MKEGRGEEGSELMYNQEVKLGSRYGFGLLVC